MIRSVNLDHGQGSFRTPRGCHELHSDLSSKRMVISDAIDSPVSYQPEEEKKRVVRDERVKVKKREI